MCQLLERLKIAQSDAIIKGKINFLAEKQCKLKQKQKEKENRDNKKGETSVTIPSFLTFSSVLALVELSSSSSSSRRADNLTGFFEGFSVAI